MNVYEYIRTKNILNRPYVYFYSKGWDIIDDNLQRSKLYLNRYGSMYMNEQKIVISDDKLATTDQRW